MESNSNRANEKVLKLLSKMSRPRGTGISSYGTKESRNLLKKVSMLNKSQRKSVTIPQPFVITVRRIPPGQYLNFYQEFVTRYKNGTKLIPFYVQAIGMPGTGYKEIMIVRDKHRDEGNLMKTINRTLPMFLAKYQRELNGDLKRIYPIEGNYDLYKIKNPSSKEHFKAVFNALKKMNQNYRSKFNVTDGKNEQAFVYVYYPNWDPIGNDVAREYRPVFRGKIPRSRDVHWNYAVSGNDRIKQKHQIL